MMSSIPGIVKGIKRRASDRYKKFLKISFYLVLIVIVAIVLYFLQPFVIPVTAAANPNEFPLPIILFFILGIFEYDLWVQFVKSNFTSKSIKHSLRESGVERVVNSTKILLFCALILYLFSLDIWAVYQKGYQSGCEYTLNRSSVITLYSTEELPLENLSHFGKSNNIFEYSGYSGLVSDDYLLLYKNINITTNRPEKIYFVPKNKLLSFNFADVQVSETDMNKNKILCETTSSQQVGKLLSTAKTP